MSRLRKSVVPFSWNTITANFTQGTASSVNLAAFLRNPQGRVITYSVIGFLPSGVTLSGSVLSYNGSGAVATTSAQFRASSGAFTADSAATSVQIAAPAPTNLAPIWQGSNPISLGEREIGSTVSLIGYVSDVDGPNPLTFSRTGSVNDTAPGTVTVSSSGLVTFGAGTTAGTIEVSAFDGIASSVRTFSYTVPAVIGDANPSLAFADIPEIAFVRGVAEYDDLAPFVLDTANRINPGSLSWLTGSPIQRHSDLGGGEWSARLPVSVVGTLPQGVTWDAVKCRLVYDGYGPGTGSAATNETVTIRLSCDGQQSAEFNVRILVPTIVYGVGAIARNAAMGWNVPASNVVERNYATLDNWDKAVRKYRSIGAGVSYNAPNVFFVTAGTYSKAAGEDFFMPAGGSASAGMGWFYLLGDPAAPTQLRVETGVFRCLQTFADLMYVKNLDTTAVTFPIEQDFGLVQEEQYGQRPYVKIITKVNQKDSATNNDGIASPPAESTAGGGAAYPGTWVHIWNMRQSNMGGNANTFQSMYLEGRPYAKARINNVLIDGTRLCAAIQSTVQDICITNNRINVVPGADPNYTGYRSTAQLDIHPCNFASIYNNWIVTGSSRVPGTTAYRGCIYGPVSLEGRRSLLGGNDYPPYPDVTWQRIPEDGPAFVPYTATMLSVGFGNVGDVGTLQYGPTRNGPWTSCAATAFYSGTANNPQWDVTIAPNELNVGLNYLRIRKADGTASTKPKVARVHRTATELAVTFFWVYGHGTVNGWDMDSVSTFVNPAFWDAMAAIPQTDMTTPLRWRHFYSYNVFEWMDFAGEQQQPVYLSRNKGTQPVTNTYQFSSATVSKRAPANFVERSTAFWCNNRLINARLSGAANLFSTWRDPGLNLTGPTTTINGVVYQLFEYGTLWSQADIVEAGSNPADYPRAVGPGVPDRPYFDLGGNNFDNPAQVPTFVSLPANFRISSPRD